MAAEPLAGRRVLVTRPAERAGGLVARIEAAGGIALRFPVIEIEPLAPGAGAPAASDYDAIVFVSPAAVGHGLPYLDVDPARAPPLAAVGRATAAALVDAGHAVGIEPVGSESSEGLLRSPAFTDPRVAGARVLIVRGEGGRDRLAAGLMARGATVDYAEVYRRRRPAGLDPAVAAGCDIVSATSGEGVANLLAVLDDHARAAVRARPIAVSSERIGAIAREHGFEWPPRVAPEAGDAGLLEAIRRCAAALPEGPSEPA